MSVIQWDQVGERLYETGVDHGVLYIPDNAGNYDTGEAWNGLTTVTESPTGAEASPQYADNIKYLNLISAEEFAATIEAFTYPDSFAQCDGSAEPQPGITIGQQTRKQFGFSYRTKIGNDTEGLKYGYKLHLIYNALAAPSEKAHATINDSPEAITFSWELTTTPVTVGNVGGTEYDPTATLTIDSTKVNAAALQELEDILYGTAGTDPRLPLPAEVIALFSGTVTVVNPTPPTYNSTTKVITIPAVAGVTYYIDGEPVASGVQPAITEDTVVSARPNNGYTFPDVTDDDWLFDF